MTKIISDSPYVGAINANQAPADWPLTDMASILHRTSPNLSESEHWQPVNDMRGGPSSSSLTMPPHQTMPATWDVIVSDDRAHEERHWPLPQRSMSFGSLDNALPQQAPSLPTNPLFMPYHTSLPHHAGHNASPKQAMPPNSDMFIQIPPVPQHVLGPDSMHATPATTPIAIETGQPSYLPHGQPWGSYTFGRTAMPTNTTFPDYAPAYYSLGSTTYANPPVNGQHVIYGQAQAPIQAQQYPFYPPSSTAS